MDYGIKIDGLDKVRAALAKYPEQSKKYFSRAINAALAYISKEGATDSIMQFKTPREERTGMLQQSFDLGLKPATESKLSGSIGPTVKYAVYVEMGTAAHIIRAVKAKCLANVKRGEIYGALVHHPGTQANPFMERIVQKATPEIQDTFDHALELVLNTLGNG